jgi:hypothetical protein
MSANVTEVSFTVTKSLYNIYFFGLSGYWAEAQNKESQS